ncbi:DUF676-domain-containing protein [Hysterangium stoloniferum]|nr:DUF676-domain-containing protein [Hysterangium stoloniferum]
MESKIHFLVLIHGMWGNPTHLAEMHRIMTETYAPGTLEGDIRLEVLVAQTNRDQSTYDGIDWGAERIAEEVVERVAELEHDGIRKVTRFSVVGYSLGGLLARYLIGVLYSKKFFEDVEPVNFVTVATPHLGLTRTGNFRARLFARLGPHFLSRTGEHFYGVDEWAGTGKPLIEVMADKDHVFFQGLSLFPHITIYANAVNDRTVPFVTAAIEAVDPRFSEQYDPILESFELPSSPPPKPNPSVLSLAYYHNMKFRGPWLPPALQFRFPGNIIFMVFIPVLFPVMVGVLAVRLGLDARASRARIRLLETDPSRTDTLSNMLRSIEKNVDDAVADILDDPGEPITESETSAPATHETILTARQHRMATSLNSLPQLRKHFVFIHPITNSHATIVSRDVKRFVLHKRGEGVLRHLAHNFEL